MYQKVLVPVDGSDLAECTLSHVRAIAKGCQVPKVVVLRISEPVHQVAEMGEEWRKTAEKNNAALARDYVAQTANALKKEGIAAEGITLYGNPAEEILNFAKKSGVDLIIMSTHGRAGVSRWAMGSVADRVVRHSMAPVLVVSPAGCRMG